MQCGKDWKQGETVLLMLSKRLKNKLGIPYCWTEPGYMSPHLNVMVS